MLLRRCLRARIELGKVTIAIFEDPEANHAGHLEAGGALTTETESRVQELCHKLLSLQTDAELESLLTELRGALREHIRMARSSLEEQSTTLFLLESMLRSSESRLLSEEK